VRARPPIAAATLLAALALSGCGGGGESTSTPASLPNGCEEVSQPPPKHVKLKPPHQEVSRSAHLSAVVDTSCGSFTIKLDPKHWPKTVSSFVYLAKQGVYDDTTFHRVVPGFVIQGGDPEGNGTGGPGYSVDEKPPDDTEYTRGVVAMAKTSAEPPGRSGSQFFVVTAADAGLPPDYAVVGKLRSGDATVNRIESLGVTGSQTGMPTSPIVIKTVTIKGG